ncbi:Uncharacterized protein Rs2_24848 [Raphanus sativus]|nr:Uncharacterized protein Rs2_24848 [Raphanus sativus]
MDLNRNCDTRRNPPQLDRSEHISPALNQTEPAFHRSSETSKASDKPITVHTALSSRQRNHRHLKVSSDFEPLHILDKREPQTSFLVRRHNCRRSSTSTAQPTVQGTLEASSLREQSRRRRKLRKLPFPETKAAKMNLSKPPLSADKPATTELG